MDDIVNYARIKLQNAYGYCAVAMGDDFAQINTSDEKEKIDFKIVFTAEKENDK